MGVRVTHQMGTRVSPFFSHGCCCSSSCSLGQQGHFVLCFPNWKGEPNGLFNNIIRGEDRISSPFVKKEEKKTNLEGIEGRSDGLETFLKLLNGRERIKNGAVHWIGLHVFWFLYVWGSWQFSGRDATWSTSNCVLPLLPFWRRRSSSSPHWEIRDVSDISLPAAIQRKSLFFFFFSLFSYYFYRAYQTICLAISPSDIYQSSVCYACTLFPYPPLFNG